MSIWPWLARCRFRRRSSRGRSDASAEGIHAALKRAKEGAQGQDVRLGGGVATIRQYLIAGLIDEIHLAISPVLLGRGEHLLAGIDTVSLGFECTQHASTDHATHVVLSLVRALDNR